MSAESQAAILRGIVESLRTEGGQVQNLRANALHHAAVELEQLAILEKAVVDWLAVCGCCSGSDTEIGSDGAVHITRLGIEDALERLNR